MYTYFPPFLLTLLHPLHSFFTELRTFIPLICSPTRRCDNVDARGAPSLSRSRWNAAVSDDCVEVVLSVLREGAKAVHSAIGLRTAIDGRMARTWYDRRKACRVRCREESMMLLSATRLAACMRPDVALWFAL